MSDHSSSRISRFAGLCLLGGAIAQAVVAIVFFYAANWWGMAPALKVGLIYAALLVCVVAAALSAPRSFSFSSFVVAGSVLSGILFMVHGQIWQSGASAWHLFALWTGLALFWAILSESDGGWITAALIGVTALVLWYFQTGPRFSEDWLYPVIAAFLGFILAGRFLAARRPGGAAPSDWLKPVMLTLIVAVLVYGGIAALPALGPALIGIVVCVALMVGMPFRRFGPWPFSLALIGLVILVEAIIIRHIFDLEGVLSTGSLSALLLAVSVLILGSLAGLTVILRRLFARISATSETLKNRLHTLSSFAIGIGAWIAVGLAAAGWIGLLSLMNVNEKSFGLVIAIPAAFFGLILREGGPFATHSRAAFMTLAYGAVLFNIGANASIDNALPLMAIASVAILPALLFLSRNQATGAVGTALAVLLIIAALLRHSVGIGGLMFWVLFWAAGGGILVRMERPSMRAAGVVLLVSTFVFPAFVEFFADSSWLIRDSANPLLLYYTRGAAALAAIGIFGATAYVHPPLRDWRILTAAALTLVASLVVPAGAAGLVALGAVATIAVGGPLLALGFAAAAWSISRFYYSLLIPLDSKALAMAGGAAITLLAWYLIVKTPWKRPVLRPVSLIILGICALLPIAIEFVDFNTKNTVVKEGKEVLLPLRPVDPRSLLQGDYMQLSYGIALNELSREGGPVFIHIDEDGIVRSARPADGTPTANEIVLNTYAGYREPRLAPDSFLFEEGTGATWAQARYAIVRIHNGALVMTGLADADRQPLKPPLMETKS